MEFFTYEETIRHAIFNYGRSYDKGYDMSYFEKLDKKINKQYFFKHMPRINTKRLSSQIWMNAISETGDVNYGCTAEFMAIMLKEALLCDIPEELRKIISDYCYRGIKNYNFVYDNHTMFWYMKRYLACYAETLFHIVGRMQLSEDIGYPTFLLYNTPDCFAMHNKRPNKEGTMLEDCTSEESDKASGDWLSPEDHERIRLGIEIIDLMCAELRAKNVPEDDIYKLMHYIQDKGIV